MNIMSTIADALIKKSPYISVLYTISTYGQEAAISIKYRDIQLSIRSILDTIIIGEQQIHISDPELIDKIMYIAEHYT